MEDTAALMMLYLIRIWVRRRNCLHLISSPRRFVCAVRFYHYTVSGNANSLGRDRVVCHRALFCVAYTVIASIALINNAIVNCVAYGQNAVFI